MANFLPDHWRIELEVTGPKGVWTFARPYPENPMKQIIEPWRYGNTACAEFWQEKNPESGPSGIGNRTRILPPAAKSR